jgi:predicted negative regulator of RcsB-dependent stress response
MSSETTESTGMIDLLAWFETNKQKLVSGGVVVLILGFFGYFFNWKTTQTELDASDSLYKVRVAASKAEETTVDPTQLLKVASDHSGTAASGRALLFAADSYFKEGQYADAQKQFEAFLVGNPDSPLRNTAMYGVAACKDAQGQTADAIDEYRRVASSFANTFIAFQAKLALAGLYESQGQAKEALGVYDELSLPTIPTAYSMEAGSRRESLLKKHPELAPAEEVEATISATE